MYYNWKAEHAVDELKRMVDLRIPYPEIGRRLGISVGSVCGKVHRLGIGRGPYTPDRLFVRSAAKFEPDAAHFAILERQEAEERTRPSVALEDAEDHCCRYVIGDPTKRRICGAQRYKGTPYCEEHARLCYSDVSLASRQAMGNQAPRNRQANRCSYCRTPLAPLSRALDPRTFEEADAPDPVTHSISA